ncbi:MAG TPA: MlaD family protein [Polyangiales bacterium]|nr:MlaD family protein [Polyangiales bacterium]
MEREANYAAVGAFVLLVVVMGALFVYWYSESREYRNYVRYEIYFDGTVSGLTRGAPVRYLGVDVGRVVAMHIDPRNPSRVQVIVDIDQSAPVSDKTVAELSLQGVTGVLYIDLASYAANMRLSEPVPSQTYPVIRAARSNFDVLLASLPQMVGLLSNVLERAERALSDTNIAAVSHTLASIDKASVALPGTLREVQLLVADLRTTSTELRNTASSVRGIADDAGPQFHKALDRVVAVSNSLADTTAQLDQLVLENRADVRAFTRDGLPELERLLRDGRDAAQQGRDLAQDLRANPSQLIYQAPADGMESPR